MADETRKLQIVIQAQDEATKVFNNFNGQLNSLKKNIGTAGVFLSGIGAATGLMAKSFVDAAGEMEATKRAFVTLTGDAKVAKKTLDDLFSLESRTPFTIQSVLTESKKLLAMGTRAENLTKTLTMLGDVAAGVGFDKLPQLTLAFGQIQAKGRLMGTELRQLTEAGFNLAEAMGVSSAELDQLISDGKVGFEDVRLAFEKVTGEGGRFNGLMGQLAQTTPGRLSTLESSIYQLKVALGEALLPTLNLIIDKLLPLVQQFAKFAQENQQLVLILTAVGIVLGVLGATILILGPIFAGLGAIIGTVTAIVQLSIGVIGALITLLGGPLILVILAVIAAAALLTIAWKNNWGGIQEKTKAVVDWFANVGIPTFMQNFNLAKEGVSNLAKTWIDNFNKIVDVIQKVIDLASKVKNAVSNDKGGFKIPGFQHGGVVQGSYGDAIPALLHPGERVIPKNGVDVNTSQSSSPNVSIQISGTFNLDSEERVQELADKIIRILGRQNELAAKGAF